MKRKLADQLIKKVVLRLDNKDWQIVVTHNVLIEVEAMTGLNVLTGGVNLATPSATLLRALLFTCLRRAGAKYTIEEVGELIIPNSLPLIIEAIGSAWFASNPDPEESDPTQAAASN